MFSRSTGGARFIEACLRTIIFVAFVAAGVIMLAFGPKYPDNALTAGAAVCCFLCSFAAFIGRRAA